MIPRAPRRSPKYFNLSIIFFIALAALVTVGALASGGPASMKEAHQAGDKKSLNSGGAGTIQSSVVKAEPAPQSQQSPPPTQNATMQDAGDGPFKPYTPPPRPDRESRPALPGSDLVEFSAPRKLSKEQEMLMGPAPAVSTFTIVIVPGAGLAANPEALAAFNTAAASWSKRFTDPIVVTIEADLAPLGPGIIGSTQAVSLQGGYNIIRDAVVADATSSASVSDNIAASLPTAAQFVGTVPTGFTFGGNIAGTKANLKALGFTGLDLPPAMGGFGPSDGHITFSTNFAFDYDRSDGVTAGTVDFETVATHEIGHLLGFISAVDNVDATLPATSAIQPMPLDLFRFKSDNVPTTPATFTTLARNFVPGAVGVTSDTVTSPLMSTGFFNGDGRQASHWKDDTLTGFLIGVMDPTLSFATIEDANDTDFHAFDLIGYDVSPPTLGNYPDTSVALGASATITPFAVPTLATGINVSTSTNFKGTFAADPATGVVRVTNAHPAGAYTVTVKAFGGGASTSTTFTLTVQQGVVCAGVSVFTSVANVSAGGSAQSVAVGDFNSDGAQDIAVANYGPGTVSIRLGNGLGGFSGPPNISVGPNPYFVAIGDFNNDGKQDFATANLGSNPGTVSIRLGDGAGNFSVKPDVGVGNNPQSVAIGDFNSDGKQDLATANVQANSVSIRLGDGAGNFSGTTEVSVGNIPKSVAVGDFNADGKQDFAATNGVSNSVSIRLGDGAGNFSGTTEVSVGNFPRSVAIGDFNGDGKQDFATANESAGTVSIRLGDGAGGFSGATNIGVGLSPQIVAIGDFNNDGRQDFATASSGSNSVSIRLGDGAGGFGGTTEVGIGDHSQSVAIGDFNNDGKQDFAAAFLNDAAIRLGRCDLPPAITAAAGLSRQQGSAASNSQIATVTDDGGAGLVVVTVTTANPSNGVTISNIVNTGGNITANIVAGCTASNASFTLQASDGVSTSTATLNIAFDANTTPTLSYTNPAALAFQGSATVSPATATDNGSITGYSVQNVVPALTTVPTVNSSGVVSITNAQPAGTHTITIRATDNCGASTDSSFTVDVNRGNQAITVNTHAPANATYNTSFTVAATSDSTLPVTYGSAGACTNVGATFTMTSGTGTCTVKYDQGGDNNFNPATQVTESVTAQKASQIITVNPHAPANATYNASFTVGAASDSGLQITFSSAGVCTNTGATFTMTSGTGTCTVKYDQAGNDNYNAATQVTESVTAQKANQTITFGALANRTFGDPDFGVSATATSSLPVSFAPSGQCTVTSPSPGTVHLTGAGSCTITASQGGNDNFNAAPDLPQIFNIARAATSTAVTSSVNPSDVGQSVTFTATVTSGPGTPTGTVQFKDNGGNLGAAVALNASGVAQLSTSALTTGTHTITADYSGDANFLTSTGTLSGGQVVKAQPSLSINDVSIVEGDAGTKVLNFTVTLSAASSLTVTTNYATANDTATAPSDYVAIASTLLTFNPGDTTKQVSVTINGDISFEADETFFVNLSNPVNATISDNQGLGTIQNDDVLGGFIGFGQVNYNVSESTGVVTVTVTRTNDVSQVANVDYATDDTGASTNCAALNTGLASQRCDYTSMFGTLKFAANETQKTIDIPINLDAYNEGPETFTVKLSNPTGGAVLAVPSTALVTISDSASPTPNANDDTTTFVRQQYRDFLNREADPAGLAFWKNNIDKCNDPAQRPPGQTLAACIEVQRIVTSAAFFLSLEFKGTGGLVRDFYVAALDRPLTNNMPGFVEFMRDAQGIQKGVVVGQGNWQQVLDANRTAFMNEFVMRAEFVALYPTTDTPTQYVDKLYQHANVTGTQQERLDAIADFGGAATAADTGARGRALLRVTQNGAFQARETNRAFVQMQYFGYLRRSPNDPPDGNFNGFNFWVAKLNQFNGDFLQAEMVKAFLSSSEYRGRFGP